MRAPLIPPPSLEEETPRRRSGKTNPPIIAMESISERERLLRRKQAPATLARSVLRWIVRLVPALVLLVILVLLLMML